MSDAAPELGERAFGALPSTLGRSAGEHRRVNRPCARRADAFERDALILQQAVEDTPGKGGVRAAALQGKVIDLISTLGGRIREGLVAARSPGCVHRLLLVALRCARNSRLPFTEK